jgi:hypothetical protein
LEEVGREEASAICPVVDLRELLGLFDRIQILFYALTTLHGKFSQGFRFGKWIFFPALKNGQCKDYARFVVHSCSEGVMPSKLVTYQSFARDSKLWCVGSTYCSLLISNAIFISVILGSTAKAH